MARLDSNHRAVVEHLRGFGMSVKSLAAVGSGCADLLVGYQGINVLLEVKREKGELTPLEEGFRLRWRGQYSVVRSPEEALEAVYQFARANDRAGDTDRQQNRLASSSRAGRGLSPKHYGMTG
jgi:hypothetical protein